jgi:uncharacterized protein YgiM (DUF1202 family)
MPRDPLLNFQEIMAVTTLPRYWAASIFLLALIHLSGCAKVKPIPEEPITTPPVLGDEKILKKSTPLPSIASKYRTWFVSVDKLHLRVCAGLNCMIAATLNRGEELFQTGEKGEWIRVRVKNTRKEGWVSSAFLGKEPPLPSP